MKTNPRDCKKYREHFLKNGNLGAGPFVDCIRSGSAVNDEKNKIEKDKDDNKESKSEAIKDKER